METSIPFANSQAPLMFCLCPGMMAAEGLATDGHVPSGRARLGHPQEWPIAWETISLAAPLLDPLRKAVRRWLPLAPKPVAELWSLCCLSLKVCVLCAFTLKCGLTWPGRLGWRGSPPPSLPEHII